jgi:hypothetical protein
MLPPVTMVSIANLAEEAGDGEGVGDDLQSFVGEEAGHRVGGACRRRE